MIFNIEPLDGALPKPASEPFHKSCRIIHAEAIRRRVHRLIELGENVAAAILTDALARVLHVRDEED